MTVGGGVRCAIHLHPVRLSEHHDVITLQDTQRDDLIAPELQEKVGGNEML